MRILVIEDDCRIRSFIRNGLRQEGHVVDDAALGKDGLAYWMNSSYDAVVLDITLPGLDGLSILKTMRQKGDTTPAIIVSAKKAVDERVTGLRSGADDYLTKPFAFSELLARLLVITRRRNTPMAAHVPDEVLTIAGITLDSESELPRRKPVMRNPTLSPRRTRHFACRTLV